MIEQRFGRGVSSLFLACLVLAGIIAPIVAATVIIYATLGVIAWASGQLDREIGTSLSWVFLMLAIGYPAWILLTSNTGTRLILMLLKLISTRSIKEAAGVRSVLDMLKETHDLLDKISELSERVETSLVREKDLLEFIETLPELDKEEKKL